MLKPKSITSQFLTNAAMLSSGTALAQLFALLASPLLTRIYSPEDFGIFSIYSAILSIMVVVVCFRYELAIALPVKESSADALLSVSVIATIFLSIACGIGLLLFSSSLGVVFDLNNQHYILWFLPLSLLFAGLYKAASFWVIRQKTYKYLAISKVSQSVPQTLSQIVLGILSMGTLGLVLGDLIGKLIGNVTLWMRIRRDHSRVLFSVSAPQMHQIAGRYKRFPLISSWSAIINQAGLLAPTLLLAGLYGQHTVGWYALVQRVLAIPMDLVGQTVLTLYIGEAAVLKRQNIPALQKLFLKSATGLFLIGLVPTGLLIFFGEPLFVFVFGSKWSQAGYFAQILSVAFLFRFAISPLSQTLNIIERQDLQFMWDVCRLGAVIGAFAMIFILGHGAVQAIVAYTLVVVVTQISYAVLALVQINRLKA